MTRSASERIARLMAWCKDNGVQIDTRLGIRPTDQGDVAVFANVNEYIANPVSLVQIPKSAVLSVRSCSLSNYIPFVPYGQGAHLSLALALYAEMLLGERSRWFGYIQSLPEEQVDISLFWGHDTDGCDSGHEVGAAASEQVCPDHDQGSHRRHRRIVDGAEALAWLRGTEVLKQLRGSEDVTMSLLHGIRQYYYTTVDPLLSRLELCHCGPGFDRAYSLVSSRAFLVDAYHGLAMVPVADAFNHSHENHVHLESDYDVCSTCGSLAECAHDGEEGIGINSDCDTTRATDHAAGNPVLETDSCYEMISNAPILPNVEVFNTYGETLNNAQLLARYGFALDGNENDRVTWATEELWTDYVKTGGLESGQIERITELWVEVVEKWPDRWGELFSESELVQVNPRRVWTGGRGGNEDIDVFWVNADGKITHQMWLYCALLILGDGGEGDGIEETLETLSAAADLQVELEKELTIGNNGWDEGPGTCIGPKRDLTKIPTVVTGIGRRVLDICLGKKDQIGKIGCHTSQLGRFADDVREDMPRTRLAMMEVMTERSILDSCESNWRELLSLYMGYQ